MNTKKTTPKRAGTKTTSFLIRMNPEEKIMLAKAAASERRTLANFLILAGLERAGKVGK